MKKNNQKEFIKGLLNYKSNIGDPKMKAAIGKIQGDITSEVANAFYGLKTTNGSDITFEDIEKMCEDNGMEPIEMVEYAAKLMSSCKTFTYDGITIDFSKTKNFLDLAKEKFNEHKESEDINNF